MLNPTLSDLVGGIQPVTLGDEEARRRGTQKTVLERKAPPTARRPGRDRRARQRHRPSQRCRDGRRHPLRGHMVLPEPATATTCELKAATKYDYRISETAAGNPAFAPPSSRPAASAPSAAAARVRRWRPIRARRPSRSSGGTSGAFGGEATTRGPRTLPGERLSGTSESATDREARDELERALAEMADEASVDRPVGAQPPASERARSHRPMSVFPRRQPQAAEQAVRELGVPVTVARELDEADAVGHAAQLLPPQAVRAARRRVARGADLRAQDEHDPPDGEHARLALRPGGQPAGAPRCARRRRRSGWCRPPVARSSSPRRTPTCRLHQMAERNAPDVAVTRVGAESAGRADPRRRGSWRRAGELPIGSSCSVILALVVLALVVPSVLPPCVPAAARARPIHHAGGSRRQRQETAARHLGAWACRSAGCRPS